MEGGRYFSMKLFTVWNLDYEISPYNMITIWKGGIYSCMVSWASNHSRVSTQDYNNCYTIQGINVAASLVST